MAIYRILRPLSAGSLGIIPKNSFDSLIWAAESTIDILEKQGKIARIHAPPLHVFPGWQIRYERLSKIDIEDAEQFLEATNETIAQIMQVRMRTVRKWRAQVEAFLTVNNDNKCCGG